MDNRLLEMVKTERKFLEQQEAEKTEAGVYVFTSSNGNEHISLDFYLLEYKQWLIENKIVKEL